MQRHARSKPAGSILPITLLAAVAALWAAPTSAAVRCSKTIVANVVALDQPLMFNRMGAQNPNGMMYALRRDVVDSSGTPLTRGGTASPGKVRLRDDKRPRPLVLRVAVGECLEVRFQNLLAPNANPNFAGHAALNVDDQVASRFASFHAQGMQVFDGIQSDGSHVGANDSSIVDVGNTAIYKLYAEREGTFPVVSHGATFGSEDNQGNGANGLFAVVNVEPRGAVFYRSQLTEEELRLATRGTTGPPPGSPTAPPLGQPIIDYTARYPNDCDTGVWCREGKAGLPILAMLDGTELVHSDLNAVIAYGMSRDGVFPSGTYPIEVGGKRNPALPNRLEPFREFTVVFHDEMATAQAFPAFYNHPVFKHTLAGVRDSFMINYGSGGIGSEIIANRLRVGPMHDCLNCSYEEFFLTSYAVGDPAMLVDAPANMGLETLAPGAAPTPGSVGPKASMALYPDDPSNVHHAYLGDHVKFRNVHTGAEQHVFHLHNHQWLFNPNDDNSNYIDAQGIGPGSGYTYEIAFGGAGNRNRSAGDAIFHCHFYPHFAQGMWEHFRVHDVFEAGTPLAASGGPGSIHSRAFALRAGLPQAGSRALPDGEIVAGTPIPAIVPVPGKAMPPMPGLVEVIPNANRTLASDLHLRTPGVRVPVGSVAHVIDRSTNPGYPFWIGGIESLVGQRPTTPPLDMITEQEAAALAAGSDDLFAGRATELVAAAGGHDGGLPRHGLEGFAAGGAANVTVLRDDFSKVMTKAKPVYFPEEGTDVEKTAMRFHREREHPSYSLRLGGPAAVAASFITNGRPPMPSAPYHDPCADDKGNPITKGGTPEFWSGTTGAYKTLGPVNYGYDSPRVYKAANIQIDAVLNKAGYHYPQQRIISLWGDVKATIAKTKAPEPFAIRFNTLDCGKFLHTNLVPAYYELDDYQVRTPTDIIGQHIHLPKWDLTTTDGSGNGWNYEDGTLSPGSVRERIEAINHYNAQRGVTPVATLPGPGGLRPGGLTHLEPADHPFFGPGEGNEWKGARTTIQRWFFDPLLNANDVDRGLGTIFTHDHYGPSTHQQIGLYASVLVEPAGSEWFDSETGKKLNDYANGRDDGGPTTSRAIIANGAESYREFWFQASDFQHAYEKGVYVGAGPDGRPDPVNYPATAQTFRNVINPSVREQVEEVLPDLVVFSPICPGGVPRPCPEAISVSDPGMFVVNYRNEPVGLRVFDPNKVGPDGKRGMQADGLGGDLAYALQTRVDRALAPFNTIVGDTPYPPLTSDVVAGDPFTPILRAYAGDKIRFRVQVGGHEEELQTSVNGMKWLQAGSAFGTAGNSGWRAAQANGISEQFALAAPVTPFVGSNRTTVDYVYSASQSQDGWWSGVWGLIRTYNTPRTDLARLPNGLTVPVRVANPNQFRVTAAGICPAAAPVRDYDVTVVLANAALDNPLGVAIVPGAAAGEVALRSATQHVGGDLNPSGGTLVYNPRSTALSNGKAGPLHDPTAMLVVHTADLEPRRDPAKPASEPYFDGCYKTDPVTLARSLDPKLPTCPVRLKDGVPTEPITLRAAAGECIDVLLRNRLPGDVDGNGFLDDVPDLGTLGGMQNIVLRDRNSPSGVTAFNNNLVRPSSHVGLHSQLVAYDASKADGTNSGRNTLQTAAPGGQVRYRWYAGDITGRSTDGGRTVTLVATPIEFGGSNLSPADPIKQGQKALVGALVIEPAGSTWAEDTARRSAASVGTDTSRPPDGKPDRITHRSFATIFQKHLNHRYADGSPVESLGGEGPAGVLDDGQEAGQFAINNASEPLWFRFGLRPNALFGNVAGGLGAVGNAHLAYSNDLTGGADPVTPVFRASPGQAVRMHVLAPHGSYRGTTFNLHGHVWQRDPYVCPGGGDLGISQKCTTAEVGSRAIGANPVGFWVGGQESVQPYSHFEVVLPSAGGPNAAPGDYLFRDQGAIGNVSGLWGILRVQPPPAQ